jgi:predicted alpha/beta-hydrolase family hydrolase
MQIEIQASYRRCSKRSVGIKEDVVPESIEEGPIGAPLTVAFAHGAGAPMDSPFMAFFACGLVNAGWRVVRFEFPYMAARRADRLRRPPDRPDVLLDCWRSVIARLNPERLVIGGKSLGGRMASMVADVAGVRGLVCLGYPFHPPSQPQRLRIAHLQTLKTPTLIVQGTRDPFGTPSEVASYALSPSIAVHWLPDGDHGFAPRRASGRTERQNWDEALMRIALFLDDLGAKA